LADAGFVPHLFSSSATGVIGGSSVETADPIWDDFVTPPADFNQLADLKIKLLYGGSHGPMATPAMTGVFPCG